jgi:cytoplasmic iron level regulating protein YaaA (DUF328/UPF0246 family)
MKIVISPAKSLNFEAPLPTRDFSEPRFLEQAGKINKVLAKKKPKALSRLMEISDQLAELNWTRNQDFSFPFTPENARPAVFAFDGDVYQGLDAYTLSADQLHRLQNTLRILSGLYGLLRPLDLIQPYRLEMGTKLQVGRKKNLYDFWKAQITAEIDRELDTNELLINLASNEYWSVIDQKALKATVITPVFKDWSKDKLKVISFYAKRARGAMVRHIVDHNAQSLDEIRGFNYEGYEYSKEHTLKESQPVFVR